MAEPFKDEKGDVDVGSVIKFAGTALGTLVSLFSPPAGAAIATGVNVGVDAFDKKGGAKGKPGSVRIEDSDDGSQVIRYGQMDTRGQTEADLLKGASYYGLRDSPNWTPGGKATPIVIPAGGGKSAEGDTDATPTPPAVEGAEDNGGASVVVKPEAIPGADEDDDTPEETTPDKPAADAVTVESPDTDAGRVEVEPDTLTGPARIRAEDADEANNGPAERDTSGQETADGGSWLAGFGTPRYA